MKAGDPRATRRSMAALNLDIYQNFQMPRTGVPVSPTADFHNLVPSSARAFKEAYIRLQRIVHMISRTDGCHIGAPWCSTTPSTPPTAQAVRVSPLPSSGKQARLREIYGVGCATHEQEQPHRTTNALCTSKRSKSYRRTFGTKLRGILCACACVDPVPTTTLANIDVTFPSGDVNEVESLYLEEFVKAVVSLAGPSHGVNDLS